MPPRVRRPTRVQLPGSAFVDTSGLCVPESVADLESVPGRCYTRKSAVICGQAAPDSMCVECAMAELGETLELFNARTNAGIPKAKFYRDLERAQSVPDADYRRMMEWKRRRNESR